MATIFSLSISSVALAEAPGSNEARALELVLRADELVNAGKCAEAIPLYASSERLKHDRKTLYNLANAYECMGRVTSAWKTFVAVWTDASSTEKTKLQHEAKERARLLESRLPKLRVRVPSSLAQTPGIVISIDEITLDRSQWNLPTFVDPGSHTITASAPGYVTWAKVTYAPKDPSISKIQLPKVLPPVRMSKQRVAAIAVGATGAAIGIAAIATGAFAQQQSTDAKEKCRYPCFVGSPNAFGVDGAESKIADAQKLGYVSTAFYVTSGVAIGTAAILWFTTPNPAKKDVGWQFVPVAGLGYAGAEAHFRF